MSQSGCATMMAIVYSSPVVYALFEEEVNLVLSSPRRKSRAPHSLALQWLSSFRQLYCKERLRRRITISNTQQAKKGRKKRNTLWDRGGCVKGACATRRRFGQINLAESPCCPANPISPTARLRLGNGGMTRSLHWVQWCLPEATYCVVQCLDQTLGQINKQQKAHL